jgi:hypothetical protein
LIFGNLNLLETSGPVQTCKGIALPLQHILWIHYKKQLLTGYARDCSLKTEACTVEKYQEEQACDDADDDDNNNNN